MDKSIAEIAGKLTEAQREIILRTPLQEFAPAFLIAPSGFLSDGAKVVAAFYRHRPELCTRQKRRGGMDYRLSQTGLALRNYLNGE